MRYRKKKTVVKKNVIGTVTLTECFCYEEDLNYIIQKFKSRYGTKYLVSYGGILPPFYDKKIRSSKHLVIVSYKKWTHKYKTDYKQSEYLVFANKYKYFEEIEI